MTMLQVGQQQIAQFRQLLQGDATSTIALNELNGAELAVFSRILHDNLDGSLHLPPQTIGALANYCDHGSAYLSLCANFIAVSAGCKVLSWVDDVLCPPPSDDYLSFVAELTSQSTQEQFNRYGLGFAAISAFFPTMPPLKGESAMLMKTLLPLCYPGELQYVALFANSSPELARLAEAVNHLPFSKISICQSRCFHQLASSTTIAYLTSIEACNEVVEPSALHLQPPPSPQAATWDKKVLFDVLSCNTVDSRRNLALFYAAQLIRITYPEVISLAFAVGLAQESLDQGSALQLLLAMQKGI